MNELIAAMTFPWTRRNALHDERVLLARATRGLSITDEGADESCRRQRQDPSRLHNQRNPSQDKTATITTMRPMM